MAGLLSSSSSSCAITKSPAPDDAAATASHSPAMNAAAGIIREAIKLSFDKVMSSQVVILFVLSPFALLVLLHSLIAGPLMQKVEDSYERSALDPKDVRALLGLEIPFVLAFCIALLFKTMITIFASVSAYTTSGRSPSLKESISWILSTGWKKPMITWLYVSLLTIVYILLSLVPIQYSSSCGWLLGILAALFYPFFASVCTLGLVVSVVEDDFYGLRALQKAERLMKGRKLLGFILMLILTLLSIPIYILFYVTSADDDDVLRPLARFSFMFFATVLFCLSNVFTLVVYTVFYFECKQSHGEKIEMDQFGPGYHLVPPILLDAPDNSLHPQL